MFDCAVANAVLEYGLVVLFGCWVVVVASGFAIGAVLLHA